MKIPPANKGDKEQWILEIIQDAKPLIDEYHKTNHIAVRNKIAVLFEPIAKHYSEIAARKLRAVTSSTVVDVDDIAQEIGMAFINALPRIDTSKNNESIRGFLRTTALNKYTDVKRSSNSRKVNPGGRRPLSLDRAKNPDGNTIADYIKDRSPSSLEAAEEIISALKKIITDPKLLKVMEAYPKATSDKERGNLIGVGRSTYIVRLAKLREILESIPDELQDEIRNILDRMPSGRGR